MVKILFPQPSTIVLHIMRIDRMLSIALECFVKYENISVVARIPLYLLSTEFLYFDVISETDSMDSF